jgi:hypothetical protein
MAARVATLRTAAGMMLAGALGCAAPSANQPPDASVNESGAARDLAGGGDLTRAAPGDLTTASAAAADLASARDLAQPIDMALQDLGPFPPGAAYQISVKATGQLMSVHNAATANGSIIEEQPAHGGADQRWLLNASGSYWAIVNGQSQTCLDVNGASTSDGATVWIWSCSGATSQAWSLQDAGSGFYNIVNANSGSCLDLDNSGTAPGTVIFQYHCNGGDNQKWFFTRVP